MNEDDSKRTGVRTATVAVHNNVPDSGTEPVRDHVSDGLRASAAHIWLMIRLLHGLH